MKARASLLGPAAPAALFGMPAGVSLLACSAASQTWSGRRDQPGRAAARVPGGCWRPAAAEPTACKSATLPAAAVRFEADGLVKVIDMTLERGEDARR